MSDPKPKVWSLSHSPEFVTQHTEIPSNPEDIPNVIGWSGPARSGTTALLYLLADHPEVDRVYFQPQKTLMRLGEPNFKIHAADDTICTKETFWSMQPEEPYDPIHLLMNAGVPAQKIN